ncbi:MAG: hypothetical protein KDE09_13720 [Anaerolineales bacterium]|nr:hypothetical protein [Anaerolineales bacterium]MCB0029013.1 hypothetical protein [Anaerolineales bacterium]
MDDPWFVLGIALISGLMGILGTAVGAWMTGAKTEQRLRRESKRGALLEKRTKLLETINKINEYVHKTSYLNQPRTEEEAAYLVSLLRDDAFLVPRTIHDALGSYHDALEGADASDIEKLEEASGLIDIAMYKELKALDDQIEELL